MIESITVKNEATYGENPETLDQLSHFNFIFGANGAGKTTISRVIANSKKYPSCSVTWKAGTALEALVYNRDFVELNFYQSEDLKGVFTLGEEQKDTRDKIKEAKTKEDELRQKIAGFKKQLEGDDGLGGKKGELVTLEEGMKTKCWSQKQKLDAKFSEAFEGFRNSQDKFKTKFLQEAESNTADLITAEELEKKASIIFGTTPSVELPVPTIKWDDILAHESNPILKKPVIGKEDIDIAALIKRLGNSDWVYQGQSFLDKSDETCPFCQQALPEGFDKQLDEYFDETFANDTIAIETLVTAYKDDSARIQEELKAIVSAASRFLDVDKLKAATELLDTRIRLNNQRLQEKQKEASRSLELESVEDVKITITELISSANAEIVAHNETVKNLASERSELTKQVWRFVIGELNSDYSEYKKSKDGLDKALSSINEKIELAEEELRQLTVNIQKLEKLTTSVQPTITGINKLLKSFGFTSFELAEAEKDKSYKLVRMDGSDAKHTLSEGEKTFVTFLYFYHLLKGSQSEGGVTTDRVVVIDDPVSSLDSDILFIVSSLIKGLCAEVIAESSSIKQIFVLTHNVYFHKEVTYVSRIDGVNNAKRTYWIIRKDDMTSKLEKYDSNPIKTSYELLWAELRRGTGSNLTIQNTLRRILENYFKILGGVNPDDLCDKFDEKDKLICKSLFSWVNDGSHSAHDDLYISVDDSTVKSYFRVFKEIFDKSDHAAHYRMMMKETQVDVAIDAATVS